MRWSCRAPSGHCSSRLVPTASPASRSISWTLQSQVCLVLLLLCCAGPSCCRAGAASLSHCPFVPFIGAGVRAGSDSDSHEGDTAAPRAVAAPQAHNQQEGTEIKISAWDAPAEPGAGPTHSSGLAVLVRAHFQEHISMAQGLSPRSCLIWCPRDLWQICAMLVPVCAVPWSDSSCWRELSPLHLPALLLFC